MGQVNTIIDKINLNASHFGSMKKEDAIAAMKKDGILETHGKDDAWAGDAWDKMVTDVKKSEAKVERVEAKEDKAAEKSMKEAAKRDSSLGTV